MDEKNFLQALKEMREKTKKRRFTQSVELIVNFRGIDFKKPANQVDVKVKLPHSTGKGSETKTLLFAKTPGFISKAKEKVDRVIPEKDISKLDKKKVAQIVNDFDLLLAEAPVMLTVGKHLGQQLAPKGKMPNPIQPDIPALEATVSQRSSVTRVTNKKGKFMPLIQALIGNESMDDKALAENAAAVVNAVTATLPQKQGNVKSIYLKETMGPPAKAGEKGESK